MKKIMFLPVFLIAVMVIFVGCGELNDNIKLTAVETNVSDFFLKYYETYQKAYEAGSANLTTGDSRSHFEAYNAPIKSNMNDTLAITLAMDFCESSADSEETIKFYEYYINGKNSKIMAIVDKETKQSQRYKTKMYQVSASSLALLNGFDFNGLNKYMQDENNVSSGVTISVLCDYSFRISYSAVTEKYTIEYKGAKDCRAEYFYSKSRGFLTLNLNATTSKTSISLYNYKNNTIGGRTIVEFAQSNNQTATQKNILEFIHNGFVLRAKMGIVKDEGLYNDLRFVQADQIATSNDGDLSGYMLTSTSENLANKNKKVSVVSYGLVS